MICLAAVLLFIILAAGLKPKGFRLANQASWIEDQPGLRFGRFGIAYTDPLDGLTAPQRSDTNGFSIEITLKPANFRGHEFKFILAFHNGKDSEQLVMGQLRSWLIVMNGDDYFYRRRGIRISLNAASPSPTTRFVTITCGRQGVQIFFDGKLVGAQKDLKLKIPTNGKARLLIGNSVNGRHYWRGDIYGLALYNSPLSSQKIASHFHRWSKDQSFLFARDDNPFVLYLFDERGGTRAIDHSGRNRNLKIPLRMQILEKRILVPP